MARRTIYKGLRRFGNNHISGNFVRRIRKLEIAFAKVSMNKAYVCNSSLRFLDGRHMIDKGPTLDGRGELLP